VRHTRYVDRRRMLRSHSTAMIPAALRALAAEPVDDVLLVCPGVVYRRDAIDRLHAPTPHQLDLWRIARRPLGHGDLREMVGVLVEALTPGRPWRWEPRVHPYTLDGRQVDVCWDGEWVEVAECGLAHPEVLGRAGLAGRNGLALGMGLDRLLMLRKAIPDIRLLRSADPRIAGQMTDLASYRPVSAMPAIRRDLSVAVEAADTAEDLGDRVREALGPDADAVEEVTVLAETPPDRLPPQAIARLNPGPCDSVSRVSRAIRLGATGRMVLTLSKEGACRRWASTPGPSGRGAHPGDRLGCRRPRLRCASTAWWSWSRAAAAGSVAPWPRSSRPAARPWRSSSA
jgi:phenylalanyl-tRNA synthetase alpha chain